jgi:hypothetical protein
LIAASHALAVIALLHPSSIPIWLRLVIIIGVVMSGIYHLRRRAEFHRGIWIWQHTGEWKNERDKFESNWRLQRIFSLTRCFVALRLVNNEGLREDVLWFCDQFDAQSFRRLRVRLQFYQVEATSPGETI